MTRLLSEQYLMRIFFNNKGKILIDCLPLNNCEKDANFRWECILKNLSLSFRFELFHIDDNGKWNLLKTTGKPPMTDEEIKAKYELERKEQYKLF